MATTVDIRNDATAALQRLRADLAPVRVNRPVGAAVVRLFQDHFAGKPANKAGWPSTGLWADFARSTNYQPMPDGVVVSVNHVAARQRYEGGEIRPVRGNWLTIPARAEAYGKRAREFPNLVPRFFQTPGGFFAALVEADSTAVSLGRARKDGSRKVTQGETTGGMVMFWLVRSVRQAADPSVLPTDDRIADTALATVEGVVDRALRRGGDA